MVRILAEGENAHRLERLDGSALGSIRGRAIRLRAFDSERRSISAAVALTTALDAALARQYGGFPRRAPALHALRLVHDGAYEWISDGRRPLARLVRPSADGASDGTYAIEFVLPTYASEGTAVAVAQLLARALDEIARRHDADAAQPVEDA